MSSPSTVGDRVVTPWALAHVLVVSSLTTIFIVWWVLSTAGGLQYYGTPARVRAYAPQHRLLRPSGPIGRNLGTAGFLMMTMPLVYAIRKKVRRLSRFGSMRSWLNVHIFCGTVGPVLVTFHTSLKFNGAIAVAYWSMVAVVLSGFVGRYLYVRIPRTIRGVEAGYDDVVAEAADLKNSLEERGLSNQLLDRIARAEREAVQQAEEGGWRAYLVGHWRARRRIGRLRQELIAADVDSSLVDEVERIERMRTQILLRLVTLERTKRAFAAWHVFHQPLVYLMFGIGLVHIAIAVYLGYARG